MEEIVFKQRFDEKKYGDAFAEYTFSVLERNDLSLNAILHSNNNEYQISENAI